MCRKDEKIFCLKFKCWSELLNKDIYLFIYQTLSAYKILKNKF